MEPDNSGVSGTSDDSLNHAPQPLRLSCPMQLTGEALLISECPNCVDGSDEGADGQAQRCCRS
jgi:hypothetical protein